MCLQEVMAALCQRHGTLAAVERHKSRQAFVPEMAEISGTRFGRLVTRVAEIALSDHSKRPDGRERPAVVAVEFIPMIAVDDDLAFWPARQFEIVEEGIARVVVPRADVPISIPTVVSAIARVVLFSVRARTTAQFDPRHLDVADVVVAIARVKIIEHHFTSLVSLRGNAQRQRRMKRLSKVLAVVAISDRKMSVRFGSNQIVTTGHHATNCYAVLGTVNARRCAPPAHAAFGGIDGTSGRRTHGGC
jgi:hypothetical protein